MNKQILKFEKKYEFSTLLFSVRANLFALLSEDSDARLRSI